MNKATKGAMAAGAAGILLLGGAGTFALWEDIENINGAPVSTGLLTLGVTSGAWTDVTAPLEPVTIPNIALFNIVPGDTLTYTTVATITAEGNNLQGELNVDAEDALAATSVGLASQYVDISMSTNTASNPGISNDGDGQFTIVSEGTYTVNVVITVAFDSTTPMAEGQNTAIDLSAIELKLEQ
jgi:spore coat-associated protein N